MCTSVGIFKAYVNTGVIKQGLQHKSCRNKEFDKLEFMGDCVLSLKITERLCVFFKHLDGGTLTKISNKIVSNDNLRQVFIELEVDKYVSYTGKLGDKMKADFIEAILGELHMNNKAEALDFLIDCILMKQFDAVTNTRTRKRSKLKGISAVA